MHLLIKSWFYYYYYYYYYYRVWSQPSLVPAEFGPSRVWLQLSLVTALFATLLFGSRPACHPRTDLGTCCRAHTESMVCAFCGRWICHEYHEWMKLETTILAIWGYYHTVDRNDPNVGWYFVCSCCEGLREAVPQFREAVTDQLEYEFERPPCGIWQAIDALPPDRCGLHSDFEGYESCCECGKTVTKMCKYTSIYIPENAMSSRPCCSRECLRDYIQHKTGRDIEKKTEAGRR